MHITEFRFGRVVRFCIAGCAGVAVYYAVLYGLTEYLGVWYVASAVIGFALNAGVNFTLQKFWTFENRKMSMVGVQMALYISMMVSFLAANAALLFLLVEYLHLWYVAAQAILTVIISVLSFIISGRIFRNETGSDRGLRE